jgi:hypothetical protein
VQQALLRPADTVYLSLHFVLSDGLNEFIDRNIEVLVEIIWALDSLLTQLQTRSGVVSTRILTRRGINRRTDSMRTSEAYIDTSHQNLHEPKDRMS